MRTSCLIVLMILFCASTLPAQNDSSFHELHEVTITGFKEEKRLETSTDIISVSSEKMKERGSFNISDGLAKMPGISQLSTGVAISKPVIRGLYGNRVLTLLSGLRFDNQQWQDEHGLGLNTVGIDRVEVIKGPMSILYGTDAVGGVLNVIEERKAPENKIAFDINTSFHTNTLGNATNIGIKGNKNNRWWRVRAGYETHGDYSDGANNRVLNSRFGGYYAKATYGLHKGKVTSVNNYNFSYNNFGFILNDIYDFMQPDERWSRSSQGPHHIVIFNVFSSQNTIVLKNSVLKFNAGVQTNNRMEDEGGGQISLNMLLATVLYNLQWSKMLHPKVEMIISHGSTFENNTNFGARKIIPDAFMYELSASAFFKFYLSKAVILETGAGVTDKWIKTMMTPGVNSADKLIHPFSKNWISANGLAGLTINPTKEWNIKLNASTGVRAPNLAELSSNGLHEGIFIYEIGDPKMKSEQNINTNVSVSYNQDWVSFSASAFYNRFFNYIYLQPTSGDFYGFPIHVYKQQNAALYGGEFEWELTPQGSVKGLEWSVNASVIRGKTDDGNYLPYIPANKLGTVLKFERDASQKVKNVYGSVGFDYVFAQNHFAPNETFTPAYHLLNASVGAKFIFKTGEINLSVVGNNLLGAKYFDHLSRFKNYGIYNVGRNIVVNVGLPFLFNYSKTKNKTK
ncbi:MAG: TonB-dependent receptor [Chitinophagales bacterium]|nr:TonB-dependent receptor [Chitinophagales bacterium]